MRSNRVAIRERAVGRYEVDGSRVDVPKVEFRHSRNSL